MRDYTKIATMFIVCLGIVFFIAGIIIAVVLDLPSVFGIGMVIIGIFLGIMPFTRDRFQG
ncbi:MAG: hypothetical protein R6U61_02120 [Thermoplasmata archaeon]